MDRVETGIDGETGKLADDQIYRQMGPWDIGTVGLQEHGILGPLDTLHSANKCITM